MNLLYQIESSFPKLIPDSPSFLPDKVTEAELHALAGDVGSFYVEDLPPYLGALLYETAKNPPSDPWQWERLIYFLNANLKEAYFAREEIGRSHDDIAAERLLRLERQKDFARLTPNQIQVVHDWLVAAQSWPLTHSLSCEIADALRYWSDLVKEVNHTSEPKHGEG